MSGASRAALLLIVCIVAAPAVPTAQAPASNRDALDRIVAEAAAKGLPAAPLSNKIQEGLAKGVDPTRIELVVRQIATNLEVADRLVREIEPASEATAREAAVTLLADAIGSGVTSDEIRDLRKMSAAGQTMISADAAATAAKSLSLIKAARLPASDGAAVIAEAMKHGFRSREILDLGREVKRREADYQAGRASLSALRDAIARGERPDQLFREGRVETVERPAATRPNAPVERPAVRPETPQRPEQPVRPERPVTGR